MNKPFSIFRIFVLKLTLIVGLSVPLYGEVLLNYSFEGGIQTESLVNGHLPWYSASSSEDLEWTENGLTLLSAERSSRHILTHFAEEEPIQLSVGESLTIQYKLSLVEPIADPQKPVGNGIRIGLFLSGSDENRVLISGHSHGGIRRINPRSAFADYTGYRFDLYPNFDSDRSGLGIFRREAHPDAALLVLSEAFSPALGEGGRPLAIGNNEVFRGKIVLKKINSGRLRISHTFESSEDWEKRADTFFVFDDGDSMVSAFDTLAFGINSRVAAGLTLNAVKVIRGPAPALPYFVGIRRVKTDLINQSGLPVIPMWRAWKDDGKDSRMAYPLVPSAQHATVWEPQTREEGAYNHYACLVFHEGRFHAMWGNHPLGEDAPGQRVLYSSSDEWGKWSDPVELFGPPGPILPRSQRGIHLKPDRWVVLDGKLFAIVYVHGAGRYPIAAEVFDGEIRGDIFPFDPVPSEHRLPSFMTLREASNEHLPWVDKIREWYRINDQISWWAMVDGRQARRGIDNATVIESFTYRAKDGEIALMMRDWGTPGNPVHSNRMYVSFNEDTENLLPPWPTNIPDSPTRSEALRLECGTILLIGSQLAISLDEALYLDRDPLTISISKDGYVFDEVHILRTHSKSQFRIPGVSGRNHGFAYSSSIVKDGWLYTLYSISKEDMGITRARLNDLVNDNQ